MGLAVISTALRASVLHFGPACTPGPFGLGVGGALVTEGGAALHKPAAGASLVRRYALPSYPG